MLTSISVHQARKVVVLGTGGTIAGLAASPDDDVGYTAGQVPVGVLLRAVADDAQDLECHQVAQLDSKDMDWPTWVALAQAVQAHLQRPEVSAVVITHGTDTMEETAYFLHAVLPQAQRMNHPVVLTGAMRPASSRWPDGPQNLHDALRVAMDAQARGVLVVCAGEVHRAVAVSKRHSHRLQAFDSGDAGVLGRLQGGVVAWVCNPAQMPVNAALAAIETIASGGLPPRVELTYNHADASGAVVRALLQPLPGVAPLAGLVAVGTGNGSLSVRLQQALAEAAARGVRVWRASSCADGGIWAAEGGWPYVPGLNAAKTRIALQLQLLAEQSA